MLLLALSDAHIPERVIDLPLKFKKLLNVPNKIHQVVLLGNCTKSVSFYEFLKGVSTNIVNVRGEFDNATIQTSNGSIEEIPINTVVTHGAFRIGCCNGYTLVPKNDPLSLLMLSRQLDVDILLWGGTHNVEAYTLEGKFFINPGSCTGAFSTDWITQEVKENVERNQKKEPNQEVTSPLQHSKSELPSEPKENESFDNDTEDDDSFDEVDVNGGGIPSFCLLDLQGNTCTLYIYTYLNDEVKVDKVVYTKE